jgi:hypothetical protein
LVQVILFGRPSKHRDSFWPQLVDITAILKSILCTPEGQMWMAQLSAEQEAGVMPALVSSSAECRIAIVSQNSTSP